MKTEHYSFRARNALIYLVLLSSFRSDTPKDINYSVYANIVYRFSKYVEWPDYMQTGYFIIGCVGDTPLYEELRTFTANKTVEGQKIIIKKFSPFAASYNCHILFIPEESSRSMKKIAEITAGSPILLVSAVDGLAKKGSCINLLLRDDRLKLEFNKRNIEERDLFIANELLALGSLVK